MTLSGLNGLPGKRHEFLKRQEKAFRHDAI